MNSNPKQLSKSTFEKTDELIRLGSNAVDAAQADSRAMGVQNVYCINGRIYYETENGLVDTDPQSDK